MVYSAFKDRFRKRFTEPNTYTLLGRVSACRRVKHSDGILMLGQQIGFVVNQSSETNELNLEYLCSLMRDRLNDLVDRYSPR